MAMERQQLKAFQISGVSQKAALEAMRELIARSLEEGLSLAEFELRAGKLLRSFELSPARLRTIWNTNVGQSMARGREEELRDPEVRQVLGWRLFDAMNDQFVRDNHLALDNGVAPADWWDGPGEEFKPLLGFNCRCVLLGITAARARRMIEAGEATDLTEGIPAGAGPDPGFRR